MRPNFELITELQTLQRRDFAVAITGGLKPYDSAAIVDGEWLNLLASYKLDRGADGDKYPLVFPVHTEKGRYDVQAIQKASVLFLGMYEAESAVYDTTGSYAVGDKLVVKTVPAAQTFTGKRGLAEAAAATAGQVIVGIVTKAPSAGNARVRFVHFGNSFLDVA
jgi:hypothetical protein